MTTLKMTIIDLKRCKYQLSMFLLFIPIAAFMMTKPYGGGITYLAFVAIILSGQPFLYDQKSESGFICMLPATKEERVIGRYLFGIVLMIFVILGSFLLNLINFILHGSYLSNFRFQIMLYFGVGMITIALQYILFYAMGKVKFRVLNNLIMMFPGFLVFFLASFIPEHIDGTALLSWIFANKGTLATGIVLTGVLLWILGIVISIIINKRRDFV